MGVKPSSYVRDARAQIRLVIVDLLSGTTVLLFVVAVEGLLRVAGDRLATLGITSNVVKYTFVVAEYAVLASGMIVFMATLLRSVVRFLRGWLGRE